MPDEKQRPVSPVNGQPIPDGKPWVTSDKRASEAGKKSVKVRRAKKTLKEELIALLKDNLTDKNGRTMNTQVAMSAALIKSAVSGNVRAFEVIRDTIGQKPAENVMITAGDYAAF